MKLSELKKLIKESVREVLREELNEIRTTLMEQTKILQPYQKIGGFEVPNYSKINSQPIPNIKQIQTTGDPLIDLLNETKMENSAEDWKNFGGFDSSNMNNFTHNSLLETPTQTGTIDDMLKNSSNSSDINRISIDTVPDFSKFMGTMKNKGMI